MSRHPDLSFMNPLSFLPSPPSPQYVRASPCETPKSPDEKQAEHIASLVGRVLGLTQHPTSATRFAPRVHAAVDNAGRGLRSGTLERQRARASAVVVAIVLISLGWPK